jgi:acetyltransferase
MNHAHELGLGFSMVASIGNKADVTANEILEFWEDDPRTDVILLYLENFGDPRRFTQIARSISRKKPIVAVKSGRTSQGAKAASSHTGALAELDVGVDALFDQCGVMRVSSVEELFDVASALANQPIPKGNRVAIVTNAGGPGLLATDALVGLGMEVAPLKNSTRAKLKKALPDLGNISNPLDLVAGAGGESFKKALKVIKDDPNFDSIIPIFVPPVTIDQLDVAKAMLEGLGNTKKSVFACFMGAGEGSSGVDHLKSNNIPVYQFPEAIAISLKKIDSYNNWLSRPKAIFKPRKVSRNKVARIIEKAIKDKQQAIIGDTALEILNHYGIPAARSVIASSATEAAEKANKIGYPVVMKINTPAVLHKTDIGAVIVDIRNDRELKSAFNSLKKKIAGMKKTREKFSVIIQQMVAGGIETVIGMSTDPAFGPLIMFGLGGIYVEILKDVSFRINPLNENNVDEMINNLKSYPLLTGFRGSEPVDMYTLRESLLRLSQLVSDFDIIDQIDINPFIACAKKGDSMAVDARFLLKI